MFQGATQLLRDTPPQLPPRKLSRGYSLLELVAVIAVGMIAAAMALPLVKSSLQSFRVQSAVSSISGAISSTRYHVIVDGCPYAVSFKKASNTYQASTRNVYFDRRFAQNGFAPPWYPSTSLTSTNPTTAQYVPTVQRLKWINNTTYY